MAAVSSPASQVFAIPELLEPILLYAALPTTSSNDGIGPKGKEKNNPRLVAIADHFGFPKPPQDLVDCKAKSLGLRFILSSAIRVNKFWNSIINDSKAIQEALFFRWSGAVYPNDKSVFNPLLVSTFTWGYFHNSLPLTEERDERIRSSIVHATASWRRMFPVVPPVKEVKAHREELTSYWDYDQDGKISLGEGDGLRMGLLFDIAEEDTEPEDTSTFSVSWSGSIDMATQTDDVREYYDKCGLSSSFQLSDFAEPTATLLGTTKTPADAVAVNSVRILMSKVDPRRRAGAAGKQSYPKLVSKGKQWDLKCIEWGECWRSK